MEGVDGYEQLRQQRKESRSNRTRPTGENLVHHSSSSLESEQDISECDNSISDEDFSPGSTPRPPTVTLEIPVRTLAKDTGMMADGRGMSVRDHYMIASSFVKSCGGNINQMSLSTATVFRQRRDNRKEISDEVRRNWTKPPFVIVHWDSKLIRYSYLQYSCIVHYLIII
jgi:hypothetical protein